MMSNDASASWDELLDELKLSLAKPYRGRQPANSVTRMSAELPGPDPQTSAEADADAIVAQLLAQAPAPEAALDPETAAWLGVVGQGVISDGDGGHDAEAASWLRTLGLA